MSIITTKKFTDPAYLPKLPGALGRSLYQGIIDEVVDKANSELDTKSSKTQGTFISATLQGGWTGSIQYAKNDSGFVTLKATITSGTLTALTLLATLPVGYRPASHISIPVITPANSGYCFLWAHTDGRLLIPQGSWSYSGEYDFEITYYAG